MESLPHVFYNDNDTSCFHWLSNLVSTGLLPPGLVSSRSIRDLRPRDIPSHSTAHFFAGIGGWPLALKLAHWPSSIPVWTGSCPCQPYSVAGKRKGDADSRNLWPEFHRLIRHHRPPVCFGEQVASADGRAWLAGVRSDLEKLGYEVGAADLCAAGVGAPHIRQRLYWVAYNKREGLEGREIKSAWEEFKAVERGGNAGGEWMDYARRTSYELGGGIGDVRTRDGLLRPTSPPRDETRLQESPGRGTLGLWQDFELIPCLDGYYRRIEPRTSPLVARISSGMVKLRGYGNSIVVPLAVEFITAFLECL